MLSEHSFMPLSHMLLVRDTKNTYKYCTTCPICMSINSLKCTALVLASEKCVQVVSLHISGSNGDQELLALTEETLC